VPSGSRRPGGRRRKSDKHGPHPCRGTTSARSLRGRTPVPPPARPAGWCVIASPGNESPAAGAPTAGVCR